MGKATEKASVRGRKARTYADKVRAGNQLYGPGCCAHNRLGGTAHKSPQGLPGIPWTGPKRAKEERA